MNIGALLAERVRLVNEMRRILTTAEKEGRALSAEDEQLFDRYEADVGDVRKKIDRYEQVEAHEKNISRIVTTPVTPTARGSGDVEEEARQLVVKVRQGMKTWIEYGEKPIDKANPPPDYRNEFRSLSAGISTEGGYLTPPEFSTDLIQDVKNETFVMADARIFPLTQAAELSFPVLTARMGAIQWGGELTQPNVDSTMAFGQRTLVPKYGSLRAQISRKLLRTSAIDIEALLRSEFAYAMAIGLEQAFMSGSGAGQPLGFFVANALGVSTARDFSTGNTATAIGADNLFEVKYGIKPQYYPRLKWYLHRDTVKRIVKLKDGFGQYLWQPGLQLGQPDMILGFPVRQSEYPPSTFTSGLYVGALADLSRYYVAVALDMELQRLDEIAARTNQVEFILRFEIDGAPVREEAFGRMQLA